MSSTTATEGISQQRPARENRRPRTKRPVVVPGADDVVEEIPFDIGCAGAIIGKGGSNIEKIQNETGVKAVRLDRLKGVVSLIGPNKESVEKAKVQVNEILASVNGATPLPVSTIVSFVRRLGKDLIGPQGSNIRQLEEKSGAKITIDRASSSVIIRGADEACVDAAKKLVEEALEAKAKDLGTSVEEITAKLQATRISKPSEPLPFNATIEIGDKKFGAVIGRRGNSIRYIQRTYKVKVRTDREKHTATVEARSQEALDAATKHINDVVAGSAPVRPRKPRAPKAATEPAADAQAPAAAPADKVAGRRRKSPVAREPVNYTTFLSFSFDPKFVPAIVGRGGVRLRLLQRRTKTKVTINRDDKSIKIEGMDQAALDEAKKFIDGVIAGENPGRTPGAPREPRQPREPRETREPREPRQPRQPRRERAPAAAATTEAAPAGEARPPRAPRVPRQPVEAKVSEVFNFPAEYRSSIIGLRGSAIRRTQIQTRTNIIIEKDSTSAKIEGATAEDVAAAKKAIQETMARRDARVASAKAIPADLPIACTFQFDLRFIPIILGRRGATVRQLQQDSNTKIEINKENPSSPLVTIRGATQVAVDEAKKLVEELMAKNVDKISA